MKRGGGGYDGLPNKRIRPANEEIRLLIQSRAAGSVIGKGGQNISKLRSDYKASITVPDCPGPERILTVSADEEAMLDVVRDLIPYLEEKQHNRRDDENCELRVLIHQSQAGAVIGKGGARIKELREETGANVKIYSACCPASTDRVMQISGKPELCVDCLRKIVDILKDSMPKGPYEPYDPHSFDEMYAADYGGYGDPGRGGARQAPWANPGPWVGGGGPGGFGGPRMGRDSMNGSFGHMGGSPGRGFGRGGDFRSPPRGYGNGGGGGGGGGGGSWGGRQSGGGGGGGGGGGFDLGFKESDDWGENKSQVTIPDNMVGAIIGKGGSRIRLIRAESGAEISIEDSSPSGKDRIVTITGSSQSIQMAQYLLKQSLRGQREDY